VRDELLKLQSAARPLRDGVTPRTLRAEQETSRPDGSLGTHSSAEVRQ
jgi:hypothetical protein